MKLLTLICLYTLCATEPIWHSRPLRTATSFEAHITARKSLNYALLMDSEMTIRVTIVPVTGFTGTFTATVDGESVEVTKLGKSKYVVDIKNVQAHQLSTEHTIVIGTEDGGSYTLIGSGLSFVKMMLAAYAGNDVAINAAIAVYRYSKFANIVNGNSSDINKTNGNSSH